MRPEIERILEEGYYLDSRSALQKAFTRFRNDGFLFLGFTLIFLVLNFAFASLPIIGKLNGVFTSLLFAGFYIFSFQKDNSNSSNTDFFKGFQFALPLIGVEIITMLLALPIIILSLSMIVPLELIWEFIQGLISLEELSDPDRVQVQQSSYGLLLLFLSLILAAYILISFMLAPLLIIDKGYGILEAVESSRKVVSKQILPFFFFFFILGIVIVIATFLSFGLALIFFYPLTYLLKYEFYLQIFKNGID